VASAPPCERACAHPRAPISRFVLNLVIAGVLTLVFNLVKVSNGRDATAPADYAEMTPAGSAA
jgi:hypothetical protein